MVMNKTDKYDDIQTGNESLKTISSIYSHLYDDWFDEVFRVYAIGFVMVVCLEILAGFAMNFFGSFATGFPYAMKRIVLPSVIDGALILTNLIAFRKWKISDINKNRTAMGVLILIATVLSCVHNVFDARFALFLVPMASSMAFANIKLMRRTCCFSLIFLWISLFMPLLWHDSFDLNSQIISAGFVSLIMIVIMIIQHLILQLYLDRENILKEILQENRRLDDEVHMDELTGIYNRKGFIHYASLHASKQTDCNHMLLVCDITNFRGINELIGEKAADDLLRYIADYVKSMCESTNDVCGRYGGDQFVLLIDERPNVSMESLTEMDHQMKEAAPYKDFSLKYGLYLNVGPEDSIVTACDRARLALASVKNEFGKLMAVYDSSMDGVRQKENKLEQSMLQALKEEQFQVYYQPKHDVQTGRIIGAEALVRWVHPEYGMISPGDFIPLFEKNGFISEVDLYVWNHVCRDLREWMDMGLEVVPVSVNASRRDFFYLHDMSKIFAPIGRYSIDKNLLHVEVTESLYMEADQKNLIDVVSRVRDAGFAIEMDDFGSGYSSLGMIGELPIDVLKLDISFAKHLDKYKNVVRAIIYLAKSLNLKTVAEGVETEKQMDILKNLGCDYIQGYYFSKPLPKQEFEAYLSSHSQN